MIPKKSMKKGFSKMNLNNLVSSNSKSKLTV
jgi:hypothetical protein